MNTLKVGYTSKAHCFTSQIVSQMRVTSPVTNKNAEFFVDAPNGALPGNLFFVKIGIYLIDIYALDIH